MDPCGTLFETSQPAQLFITSGKAEAAIANQLHDHTNHVLSCINRSSLQGKAAMPYSVVGCCEINKHSSGLPSRKDILDVLRQQSDLICGRHAHKT